MNKRETSRRKRHNRIKLRMTGTLDKPRLLVHRTLKHLSAQAIDDMQHKVIFSLTTLDKEVKQKFPSGGNIKAAEFFGILCARRAQEKGIKKIVFDRGGYLYHGRVKAFADALRKGGLEF